MTTAISALAAMAELFGELMTNWFFVVLMFGVLQAGAVEVGGAVENVRKDEPGLGQLRVRVLDVFEPVYENLRLTVRFKCIDKRPKAGSNPPRWETLLLNVPICYFRPHEPANDWDPAKKILTIHYSVSVAGKKGQATCLAEESSKWRTFDLRELCAGFQP